MRIKQNKLFPHMVFLRQYLYKNFLRVIAVDRCTFYATLKRHWGKLSGVLNQKFELHSAECIE